MIQTTTLKILSIVIVLSALLPSCSENATDTGDTASTLDILWIPKELGNRVFETGRDGALKKAEEISASGGYEVTVTYAGPESAADIEGQAALVRNAVAMGFEGVAVSCNTPDGLKDAINEVTAAGIPVMTFDADSPESDRFTYLGVDNEAGGAVAAQILGEAMADISQTKVFIISGVEGAANLESRLTGFTETLTAEYPNLEIVGTEYCDDAPDTAGALIESALADNPDLGGFFFAGLWPLFLCEGWDCSEKMPLWNAAAQAGTLKTVAFDTLEFELDFVKQGMVSGLVGQKYWGWGYDAVGMLYDFIVNQKDFSDWTDSGIDVVCPNNVDEMDQMWSDVDFTQSLTPCEINDSIIE